MQHLRFFLFARLKGVFKVVQGIDVLFKFHRCVPCGDVFAMLIAPGRTERAFARSSCERLLILASNILLYCAVIDASIDDGLSPSDKSVFRTSKALSLSPRDNASASAYVLYSVSAATRFSTSSFVIFPPSLKAQSLLTSFIVLVISRAVYVESRLIAAFSIVQFLLQTSFSTMRGYCISSAPLTSTTSPFPYNLKTGLAFLEKSSRAIASSETRARKTPTDC